MTARRVTGIDQPLFVLVPFLSIALVLACVFLLHPGLRFGGGAAGAPAGGDDGPSLPVRVSAEGTVHLRGARIELASLREEVSRLLLGAPGATVLVVAEPAARASVLLRVMDECRRAGALSVHLSAPGDDSGG